MKKLLLTCLITALISYAFGNYMFSSYKKATENILAASNTTENVYMLLYGSYNSKEKIDNLKLDDYILVHDNNFYEVYVGVSLSLENAKRIKDVYKELGNIIYIREEVINNFEFIQYISSYENDFSNLSNNKILEIEKNIMKKYKELLNE